MTSQEFWLCIENAGIATILLCIALIVINNYRGKM